MMEMQSALMDAAIYARSSGATNAMETFQHLAGQTVGMDRELWGLNNVMTLELQVDV